MKKTLLSVIVVAVLAGTFGCTRTERPGAPPEVKLGVTAALTGVVAFWGESVLEGMQLAAEEYSKAHPDRPARIIYEDNAGDAKNSIAAMRKLATLDKVSCVVSVLTPYSKPLRPLAKELKTPLLGTVVASLNFGAENEWSFRDYPTPDQLSARIAEHAYKTLGLRRAVAVVVNDEYGSDSLKVFTQRWESLGGQALGAETVTQADTDMRAQVTKLLRQKPDAVFLVIRENALGTAVRQFRELGFTGQILGINAFDSPVVWNASGPHGEGIVFASALIDYEHDPQAMAFAKSFRSRYNKDPMHTHAYGYSIAKYLLPLAIKAEGNGERMRELLATIDAETLRGHVKMLPSRDVSTTVATYKRQNGRTVIVER